MAGDWIGIDNRKEGNEGGRGIVIQTKRGMYEHKEKVRKTEIESGRAWLIESMARMN